MKTLKTTDCQSCTENTSKLNKLSREVNKISSTIQSINGNKKQRSRSDCTNSEPADSVHHGDIIYNSVQTSDKCNKNLSSSIHLRTPPSVDDTPKQNNTETLQTHATIDLTSDRLESPRITLNHGSFADAARSAPVSGTFVPLANCNNLLYNGRTFIRPNTQVRQQPTTETDWDVAFVANETWTGLSGRKSIESEAVKSVSESPRQAQTKTNGVDKQNSHHGGSDFSTEKKSEHTVPNRTEQLDKEIFVGARREPVTRYHLSNIGKESTRSGILMHFEQNGIEVTQLRIFTTRYGNLYARINVPSVFADKVESDEFPLPGGVILSKWLS